jgi:L-fuculose-phosphate aldolase
MNSYQKKFKDEINELVLAAIRLGELGYVTSHGGNLSYRVEQKVFLITPTKVVKRKMQFDDIVIIDDHGDVLFESPGRMPTGETPMHLALYRFRPDLNALVHAHPPVLTGFSMVDQDLLTRPLLPEPVLEVGPVLTVPYAEPVSPNSRNMPHSPMPGSCRIMVSLWEVVKVSSGLWTCWK